MAHCLYDNCPDQLAGMWAPMCERHMVEAWRWVEAQPGLRPARTATLGQPRNIAVPEREHVVYYVQLPHGDIKIGVTHRLPERVRGLRLAYPEAVLATERGGYALERQRHEQFADERVWLKGRATEDFAPSDRLLEWITSIRRHAPAVMLA